VQTGCAFAELLVMAKSWKNRCWKGGGTGSPGHPALWLIFVACLVYEHDNFETMSHCCVKISVLFWAMLNLIQRCWCFKDVSKQYGTLVMAHLVWLSLMSNDRDILCIPNSFTENTSMLWHDGVVVRTIDRRLRVRLLAVSFSCNNFWQFAHASPAVTK